MVSFPGSIHFDQASVLKIVRMMCVLNITVRMSESKLAERSGRSSIDSLKHRGS